MRNGGYSGNLVRSFQEPDARRLPAPAVAHGTDEGDPYPDETRVPAGYGSEYGGSDFPNTVVVGGGLILDTPPSWTTPAAHDSTAVLYPLDTDAEHSAVIGREHEGVEDRGYVREGYSPPEYQSRFEVRSSVQEDQFTTHDTNTAALVRGINSYQENNPHREGYVNGFRPGIFRWMTDNVERLRGRIRTYDLQPLVARDFLVPANVPALSNAPLYGPNFDSWVDGTWHLNTRPQLPRGPGSLDQPLLADPVEAVSSVIGGGLSG